MKRLLLLCFNIFSVGVLLHAQHNLALHLSPRLGDAPFALNTAVNAGTYEYKITRLEYYISEIKITHDGGQVTTMTDLYLLVRPAFDSVYTLGAHPEINQVESITFSVGVDQAHNHLDPASYPSGHPLEPKNPSMHWGWSAGYRFVAIEGVAGANFANVFEVHSVGDANYKTITLSTGAETHANGDKTIHLTADYAKVLTTINVSAGLVVHGSTGKAVTLMNNMKDLVFTAQTSGVTAPEFNGTFLISPNPVASGPITVTFELPAGFEYTLRISDMDGKAIYARTLNSGQSACSIEQRPNPGIYFVQLWQNDRVVSVRQLVITQ